MRAHGVAFQTDAEELSLEAVLHAVELLLHDFVERGGEQFAVLLALHGHVLAAVVHPDVHDAGVALCLAHRVGNVAAALGVLYPEVAYALVRVGEGEVAALGVREGCGVEVELHAVLLGPLHPALEVFHLDLVAVDELASEVAVYLVQVQAVLSCQQSLDELDVLAHLVDVAGTAGIVSCGLYAARERFVPLEAHHVVGLPAVQRDLLLLQVGYCLVCVYSDCGVAFFSYGIGFLN